MSIFGTILSKLGFGDDKKNAAILAGSSPQSAAPSSIGASSAPPVTVISDMDIVAKLEGLEKSHAEQLNWKTSIVDLMKLLALDSSLSARKTLAAELGCPAEKMNDSAQMNLWLHKTVLKKLAENGGNVPADLLH